MSVPCIVHEDEDLLIVDKPAGMNTHAPSPYASEGLYDWLRHREARWAPLAIVHRLDKETSGLLAFTKTPRANASLTQQFTRHEVQKRYVFLTDRPPPAADWKARSTLERAGDRYVAGPWSASGKPAETEFHVRDTRNGMFRIEARPLTGRTHQIRVHAAMAGVPILGDRLYGGTGAPRVCLHAESLAFIHPTTGKRADFFRQDSFEQHSYLQLRAALIDPQLTNACRLVHGAADGFPEFYVDRWADFLLSEVAEPEQTYQAQIEHLAGHLGITGLYEKLLDRQVRRTAAIPASPRRTWGLEAPEEILIRENGVSFGVRFNEGYSVGLFLDQRDNRRRLLTNYVGAGFPIFPEGLKGRRVLNLFAYTCGFSAAAALAGAKTTSIDLSRKYLDWGRRNFVLNGLSESDHEFLYGDVFDWLHRLNKKGARYDVVVLDPPTFSTARKSGPFRAEKDFGNLLALAMRAVAPGGVIFAATNATRLTPEEFLAVVDAAARTAGRPILQSRYVPQPPDFPIHREEPAHLKTIWLRLA